MFRKRIAAHKEREREREIRVTKLWILNFAVPSNPVAVLFHSRPLT